MGKNVHSAKEVELSETTFTQDIDIKIFQTIILQTLSEIQGITLLEGGFFDGLLRRGENIKGITIEQDPEQHSINIRVELNVFYGVSIPEKAEEIHRNLAKELTKLTGLHIKNVHIVFKGLVVPQDKEELEVKKVAEAPIYEDNEDDFTEEF
jgi:uncharacterized alkaline shock family protein YloU